MPPTETLDGTTISLMSKEKPNKGLLGFEGTNTRASMAMQYGKFKV